MLNIKENYENAKKIYKEHGIDTEKAIETLKKIPISIHCWQGDDVNGLENMAELSGGIQSTGNYPGKSKTFEELTSDIEKVLSIVPGNHRINLHACYAVFKDGYVDRDKLLPKHFEPWVKFAKKHNIGLDFNPTMFSHEKANGLTLSSSDEKIRKFWVMHNIACIKISEYIATELGKPCLMNIWIPDGYKDVPADRRSPRKRLKKSLDEIISVDYDKSKVLIAVESKVFGIGMESYTVGSHEFYMNYACENNILCLLDSGHFHPTEVVADKISSMLLFHDKLALHVTRSVRWDSDHVILLDDSSREIAKEIIKNGYEKILIGLDFFDGSINRIAAWSIGITNMQKALLEALLLPNEKLSELESNGDFTQLMMLQEQWKMLPVGLIWDYFCFVNNRPIDYERYDVIKEYEVNILSKRQ